MGRLGGSGNMHSDNVHPDHPSIDLSHHSDG
jgi:hypothetical protein